MLASATGSGFSAPCLNIRQESRTGSFDESEATPMNIADELRKLQDLHRSGVLTDEEFATAKAAVLAGNTTDDRAGNEPAMHAHLEEIKLQNEVARLDREWELEREQYMVAGKYGYRYIP